MKYLKFLITISITTLMASCSATKEINGAFINLDIQQNDGYIATLIDNKKPEDIKINEEGEFKFKAPKKRKTYFLNIKNSVGDLIVSKYGRITNKTKNVIVLNNGVEFWQKIIVVNEDEDFKSIYDTEVNAFKQLDKEKTKEVKGVFVNLGDTLKKFRFSIFRITSQRYNAINKKGEFHFKYPKNPESRYKLIIEFDRSDKLGDPTIFNKSIPIDTERIIALYDGINKELVFVKKGDDYDKVYENALLNFKQKLTSKDNHGPIFPGCEKSFDYATCFSSELNKHITRHLNIRGISANSLGLSPGKKTVYVQFEVDEKGNANIISIKAPHKYLESRVTMVFDRLPKMKAAIKDGIPIKTEFNSPIYLILNDY